MRTRFAHKKLRQVVASLAWFLLVFEELFTRHGAYVDASLANPARPYPMRLISLSLLTFPSTRPSGQVEGQVIRIKLIKRMMYGRAGFARLRQRVLHRF